MSFFSSLVRAFVISALVVLVQGVNPARAHIEKGKMPDPLAVMEYRILLDLQPEKNDIRNNLGMVLYRMNKLDEAEKEFNTVLSNDPHNFNAVDALGLVYQKRGDLQRAESQFKKARSMNPNDIMVYYHLGTVCAATGRPDAARSYFNTALDRAAKVRAAGGKVPDMAPVHKALAALPPAGDQ